MTSRIAVLGAGTMGHGIAHAAITGGFDTSLYDVSPDAIDKGRSAIEAILGRGVDLGKISGAQADAIMQRLRTSSVLPSALEDCDFVIEAAPERIDLKIALLTEVDRLVGPDAVIATNTSA